MNLHLFYLLAVTGLTVQPVTIPGPTQLGVVVPHWHILRTRAERRRR